MKRKTKVLMNTIRSTEVLFLGEKFELLFDLHPVTTDVNPQGCWKYTNKERTCRSQHFRYYSDARDSNTGLVFEYGTDICSRCGEK
jgi:hypothetical protein